MYDAVNPRFLPALTQVARDQILEEICTTRFRRRFHSRSAESGNGCREWIGSLTTSGYGAISVTGILVNAHRVAWMLQHQRVIPAGMHIDHLCRNKRCVNPSHLECVTPSTNQQRVAPIPLDQPTHQPTIRIRRKHGRPGKTYQVLWRQIVDGNIKQRGRTFPTLEAADDFIAELTGVNQP